MPRPDNEPCPACGDTGFIPTTGPMSGYRGLFVCDHDGCPAGKRLEQVLRAIAQGRPVVLEHATDHPEGYGQVREGRGSRNAFRVDPPED